MNPAILQAIQELDKQIHEVNPVLMIPNQHRPTKDEWPGIVQELAARGYEPIEAPAWGRRDKFSVTCRLIRW